MQADVPKAGHSATLITKSYAAANILRLIYIYARISALFRYSRLETDSASSQVTFDEISDAAWQLAAVDTHGVTELIRRDFGIKDDETTGE